MTNDDDRKKLKPRKIDVVSQNEKFREELLKIIEKNLSDPDFGIQTLCDKLYTSRATLFRKVKAISSEPPNEIIKSFRLKRAAQLLEDNFGNVTDVARSVGFEDQYYFSNCFNEKFGIRPKDYQLNSLKNEGKILDEAEPIDRDNHKLSEPKSLTACSLEELDERLISKSVQMLESITAFSDLEGTPQRDSMFKLLKYYSLDSKLKEAYPYAKPEDLDKIINQLQVLIDEGKANIGRNHIFDYNLYDHYDITDRRARINAQAVAAICFAADLIPGGSDFYELKTKIYGPTFDLNEKELFFDQPICAGSMSTGVLVEKDLILIHPHFADEDNISELRVIFDFIMDDPETPIKEIPHDNVYKGIEIVERIYKPGSNWALVKLDRPVSGRKPAVLSRRNVYNEQNFYVLGHPCGLPLKYAPGTPINNVSFNYFRADLDIYSGSIGAPIFCRETHELIGTVSNMNRINYRWTPNGWITLRYPVTDPDYKGSLCTRVSELNRYVIK